MRKRIVKYEDIIGRYTKTATEVAIITRVMKAYMNIIAETLAQGMTFSLPKFGKFHVVAEKRTSFNLIKNVKMKTGRDIITPADMTSIQYQYLPAVEFMKDNAVHNSNFYLNLAPKFWQPILTLIQENKLNPVEHGYQQESIVS